MRETPERRSFGRRETNALGWIRIDGRPRLPCSVRNISPVGAFLEMTPPRWLPFKFTLELAEDGRRLGCELRHTRQNGIGITFIPLDEVEAFAASSQLGAMSDDEAWRGLTRRRE